MKHTKAPIDILTMNIKEIQDAVDLGIINYETIARIYLERIEAYNDEFNAIITVNENVVEQAKKLDEQYKKSGRNSMLYGIPIVIKDNIDCVGMPTTAGAEGLSDNYPKQNANIVENLIDSGALIIAKANMSEFAFSSSLSFSSYGKVKNAYNTQYTSYGSSGGTAVAVSTGMAVAGIGTDTNSSIRVPSSAANLIGLRPTYGILSSVGVINYDATRDTVGPMTKYTSDNAIMMNILSNTSEYTGYQSNVKNLKIGVVTQFVDGDNKLSYTLATKPTDEIVLDLFNSTIEELEHLGAKIVYIEDLYNAEAYNYYSSTIAGWTMCYFFNKYINNTNSSVRTFSELVKKGGFVQELGDYEEKCDDSIEKLDSYIDKHEKYRKYIEEKMGKYDVDVLVYPTTKNALTSIRNPAVTSPSFAISPVTGMPAISIPMGFGKDELPYGIEFVAKTNQEKTLYTIASSLVKENEFRISELAPSLYQIDDDVTKLVNLYKQNQEQLNKKAYTEIKEDIQTFFENYDTYANEEIEAVTLINNYNKIVNEQQKQNIVKLGIITFGIIVILAILKANLKRKKKKKNKDKNKNKRKKRQINRNKY